MIFHVLAYFAYSFIYLHILNTFHLLFSWQTQGRRNSQGCEADWQGFSQSSGPRVLAPSLFQRQASPCSAWEGQSASVWEGLGREIRSHEHKEEGAREQLAAGWKRGWLLGTLRRRRRRRHLLEEPPRPSLHRPGGLTSWRIRFSYESWWRARRPTGQRTAGPELPAPAPPDQGWRDGRWTLADECVYGQ